jgi:cytochrome c-type biogenesis protein CcmE
MKTYIRFGVLVVVIIGTLVWLAAGGINDTKSYYKTINEISQMGEKALGKRIRVVGDVEQGSIVRHGREVEFVLIESGKKLKVVYAGTEPLPDTFRDGAQALADGKIDTAGVFHADKIAAKCASKYEAKPGQKYGNPSPINQKQAGI